MMPNAPDRVAPRLGVGQTRWLSWLTLLAGAVMCIFAALMS